jgi:hypothetical protein
MFYKHQVIKFVNNFNIPYEIIIQFTPSSKMFPFDPVDFSKVEDNDIFYLHLNKQIFHSEKDLTFLKACILHGLGHVATFYSSGENDINAHKWALQAAFNKKYYKIYRELCSMLEYREHLIWNEFVIDN